MSEFLGLDLAQWELTISAGQLLILALIFWSVEARRRAAAAAEVTDTEE